MAPTHSLPKPRGHPAETHSCASTVRNSIEPLKKPQRSYSFLKEKHMNFTGIRKTLRHKEKFSLHFILAFAEMID